MRASLTDRDADGHVEQLLPDEMVFGTSDPKAVLHQHGTSRMPRRRPVELRDRDRRDAALTLQRFLVTGRA